MARIAVIVPTRNRPDSLSRCVDALDRQTVIPQLDVVVVDDGSDDRAAVATAVAASRRARLIRFDRPRGPAAARNAGVRAANAEILLFTDDDCVPAPDWAARLAAAVEHGADVVAGVTVNGSPDDPVASASEAIRGYVQRAGACAATNNLGAAARVLAGVAFDESYRYAEDRDWCARVLASGYSLRVEPRAVVTHTQELRLSTFLRQQFGYGRGAYRFRSRHRAFSGLEAPGFYAGLLHRGFADGAVAGVLVAAAQAATAAGFVREALTDKQRRPG